MLRSTLEAAKSTTRQRHSRGAMAATGVAEAQARQCQPRGIPTIQRHRSGNDLELGLAVRVGWLGRRTRSVQQWLVGVGVGRMVSKRRCISKPGRAVGAERGATVMVLEPLLSRGLRRSRGFYRRSCGLHTTEVN